MALEVSTSTVTSPSSSTSLTSPTWTSRFHPSTNACHCLNIQLSVHPLSSPPPDSSPSSLLQQFQTSLTSPFHSLPLLIGSLDSKSIQLAALTVIRAFTLPSPSPAPSSLSPPSSPTSWILFRCLGCHVDCFALEDSPSSPRCVLNLHLLDDAAIAALQQSPSYSAAFRICIASTTPQGDAGLTPRLPSSSTVTPVPPLPPLPSSVADSLRSSLDHSIHAERVAMQMRLNQAAAEENARFLAFERRARRDLLALLHLLSIDDRTASPHPAPASPAMPRSRSPSASPRPSLPSSSPLSSSAVPPSTAFQPLSTFLRRPSRQSPRLQRLLMDGLAHSSPLSPTSDLHDPRPSSDDEADDGLPTPTRPALSSSAPRLSLSLGRMSPRASSLLPVPPLAALMRSTAPTSASAVDDDEDEGEMERSQAMILKWREQDDEEEAARAEQQPSFTRPVPQRRGTVEGGDTAGGVFLLDDTDADDSWTDMLLEPPPSSNAQGTGVGDVTIVTGGEGQTGEGDGVEGGEGEDEDEGALSDDEAVAKTSQADILAIVRRSSLVAPLRRGEGSVPSSLPIPIPAALRQLISKGESPTSSHTSSHSSASSHPARPDTRHPSLPPLSERRTSSPRAPLPEVLAQRSLSPEPSPPAGEGRGGGPEPFMPPHTMVVEPFFSFSKYRHLEGVKGGGRVASSVGGPGWGAAGVGVGSGGKGLGGPSTVVFKKESGGRRGGGVSGLTAALHRKDLPAPPAATAQSPAT